MKKFMDKVRRDMEVEQGEALQIMKKHAYMAKVYGLRFGCKRHLWKNTTPYALLYHTSLFVYDKIVPTNGSRLERFPISTDYLILDDKYHLLPFLHMNFSLIILITIFAGTETLAILVLKHAASLSEVA
ncbi:unnamed protein product, partial [Heterotrigona itama]